MSNLIEDRYIGDGVYASFDGFHIWLDLRRQDSTTRIALEPSVMRKLDRFRDDLKNIIEEKRGKHDTKSG